jgi:hypothetical protein
MQSEQTNEFSHTLGALAKALSAAQSEIKDASKDATNPHFKNRYASLASVRAAVTPALSKNGLSVVQLNEPHGVDGVCVVTLLMHESGEWIRSRLYVPVTKKDPQGFGSALTYARRYALAAICNVAADDDDDAEAASKPAAAKGAPADVKAPPATAAVDVESLAKMLKEAADAATLAKASHAVGMVKSKLTEQQLSQLRGLMTERTRELAEMAEKGKAA